MKVGVLASGGGTNLQALIDAAGEGRLGPAKLTVVGANIKGCGALGRAEAAGIPTFVLEHKRFPTRADFDEALAAALTAHGVELVALAGFMRLLGAGFLDRFKNRVVNIHPALLPAFPGVHGQRQAFEYGVKVAGCTTHFVDAGTDTGPIIAQAVVPVLDGDDEAALSRRILAEEHVIYPATIRAIAEGRVVASGRHVRVTAPGGAVAPLRTLG